MSNKKKKAPGKGKLRTLFIFIILLIAIFACGVAAYSLYEMKNMQTRLLSSGDAPETTEPVAPVMPVYVPLDTFTVSLRPNEEEYDRVLYIGLTLRVSKDDDKALIEKFLPEVRSRLLILFTGRSAEELSHQEGKAQLVQDIKQALEKPLDAKQGVQVTDVLFNAFILR
ncbi:hypothetical protein C7M52_03471 [Mixta theicola]|nr:flagellar basal body-associated protein FliL [Mixta theicola]QHM77472.1 hypothetical protein C7M52_03471 [Mixta theicola]